MSGEKEAAAELHAIRRILERLSKDASEATSLLAKLVSAVLGIAPVPAPGGEGAVHVPSRIVTIPAPIYPVKRKRYSVTDSKDTEHELADQSSVVTLFSPDGDYRVEWDTNTSGDSMYIPGGVIFVFYRSKRTEKLYLRSVTGTINVYLVEFAVG